MTARLPILRIVTTAVILSPVMDAGATPYSDAVLADGPIAYWRFEDPDANDGSEPAVLEDRSVDGTTGGAWVEYSKPVPGVAFKRLELAHGIKIEFRFEADDFDRYAGWYIGEVSVMVPGT